MTDDVQELVLQADAALSVGAELADVVQRLLHAVRRQIGMEVAWISDFVGDEQVFTVVDAEQEAVAPQVGARTALSGSFCARVLDGRAPHLIPDARREPAVAMLDVGRELRLGAYVGVPLTGADGVTSGMLCAARQHAMPDLDERDVETLKLLAGLLHELHRRARSEDELRAEQSALRDEVLHAVAGRGRSTVLQPVVDLQTGACHLYEGLSRFDSVRTPAQWFDVAHHVGLGRELELAAAASCLDRLGDGDLTGPTAVAVNLSPETLLSDGFPALLAGRDATRVVVEVTEHRPVEDYDQLARALAPWRARGLRLAVDDAGAGYASLQHVLMCRPDLIKLDMMLVRGIDHDQARQALARALVGFAAEQGAAVIAEGVETREELEMLRSLKAGHAQGYFVGRPE